MLKKDIVRPLNLAYNPVPEERALEGCADVIGTFLDQLEVDSRAEATLHIATVLGSLTGPEITAAIREESWKWSSELQDAAEGLRALADLAADAEKQTLH